MSDVLNKVRMLERYVELCNGQTDIALAYTVNKLLEREKAQLAQTLDRLNARLKEFELRYNVSSQDFYLRFERGELGDDMDLIEWSAT
jgi:hypothetical protein